MELDLVTLICPIGWSAVVGWAVLNVFKVKTISGCSSNHEFAFSFARSKITMKNILFYWAMIAVSHVAGYNSNKRLIVRNLQLSPGPQGTHLAYLAQQQTSALRIPDLDVSRLFARADTHGVQTKKPKLDTISRQESWSTLATADSFGSQEFARKGDQKPTMWQKAGNAVKQARKTIGTVTKQAKQNPKAVTTTVIAIGNSIDTVGQSIGNQRVCVAGKTIKTFGKCGNAVLQWTSPGKDKNGADGKDSQGSDKAKVGKIKRDLHHSLGIYHRRRSLEIEHGEIDAAFIRRAIKARLALRRWEAERDFEAYS